jgi:hypothetical protein
MQLAVTASGSALLTMTNYLLWPAMSVDHSQQRRSQQNPPKRNDEPERDRYDDRCPQGNLIAAFHQVGLQQKSIDHGDDGVA